MVISKNSVGPAPEKATEEGNAIALKTREANTSDINDEELWKNREIKHPLGVKDALFHMVKGSLGSGILTMPVSFKNGGLWTSLVGAIVIAVVYAHCVHILVLSSRVLCTRAKKRTLEFAEMAEVAFETGPPKCRPYTALAKNFVDVALSVTYFLCCVVYIVFTASSIKQVVELNIETVLDIRLYILMVSVVVIPIGLVRELKYLVPFSIVAILALVFSCGFVLYDVLQDLPPLSSRPAFTSFTRLPVFISTIIYSLDGIGTVLPIENTMRNPQRFLGWTGVLNISVVFLAALYSVMGFFGYLRYGEETQGTITLNISSSVMGQVVKSMVSLNVLCSYGLFLYVPCEILWRQLVPYVKESKTDFYQYLMRLVLILISVALAVIVPDLEPFVGLVGAFCSSTLVLFFPAVIETVTFWQDRQYLGVWRWKIYKNLLIILVWLLVLVTGARTSLSDIIALYQQ